MKNSITYLFLVEWTWTLARTTKPHYNVNVMRFIVMSGIPSLTPGKTPRPGLCYNILTPVRTPRLRLCPNSLTPARTPRLGLCHNTLTPAITRRLCYNTLTPARTPRLRLCPNSLIPARTPKLHQNAFMHCIFILEPSSLTQARTARFH